MLKTKNCIGGGGFKRCFTLEDEPDKVVLIGQSKAFFEAEAKMLKTIADTGAPTINYELVEVDHQGSTVTGALCRKYDFGFKRGWQAKDKLTLSHAASLRSIADKLKDSGIYIGDLQFLASKEGEIVIADPLGVSKHRQTNEGEVRRIIKEIEEICGKKLDEIEAAPILKEIKSPKAKKRKASPLLVESPLQLKTPKRRIVKVKRKPQVRARKAAA